jgi:hypothetical protein
MTDLTGLESSVKTIITTIDSQSAVLGEIKTATSTPAEKTDLSSVEKSLQTIASTIEAQNGTLADIRSSASSPAPVCSPSSPP